MGKHPDGDPVAGVLSDLVPAPEGVVRVLVGHGAVDVLDADRRTRALRPLVRAARGPAAPRETVSGPPLHEDDVIGSVRLLQAQFVGRMDRMQSALDRAVERLEDRRGSGE